MKEKNIHIKSCVGFWYDEKSVRRCCWSSIELGILNRKVDDGVDVNGRYVVDT